MVTMGVDEGVSRPEFGKCLFSHQADIFYQYGKKKYIQYKALDRTRSKGGLSLREKCQTLIVRSIYLLLTS